MNGFRCNKCNRFWHTYVLTFSCLILSCPTDRSESSTYLSTVFNTYTIMIFVGISRVSKKYRILDKILSLLNIIPCKNLEIPKFRENNLKNMRSLNCWKSALKSINATFMCWKLKTIIRDSRPISNAGQKSILKGALYNKLIKMLHNLHLGPCHRNRKFTGFTQTGLKVNFLNEQFSSTEILERKYSNGL